MVYNYLFYFLLSFLPDMKTTFKKLYGHNSTIFHGPIRYLGLRELSKETVPERAGRLVHYSLHISVHGG